jgi:nucleoporin NUP159
LAAAGPQSLILSSTDAIRNAFNNSKGKSEVIDFQPSLTLETPRLSHVAFTADVSCLVIAAQTGGGLAVYSVEQLGNGVTKPAFELPTGGVAIRVLAPNPSPEFAHVIAVILENGRLMMANLKDKSLIPCESGSNPDPLSNGVVCVSWSVRGKQLVAGLPNGTAIQLEPPQSQKAIIPRPPGAPDNFVITTILWLGNDEFLVVLSDPNPTDKPPEATFYFIRTVKDRSQFEFRKILDPSFAGENRFPLQHYAARIKGWGQLADAIFTASSASSDIALFTNSEIALTPDQQENIVNTYTLTIMESDSRKAALPVSVMDEMGDTCPLGMAIDYSSKDKVWQPIPGDDIVNENSPHPLPALCVLNNEGVLSYWWFVNDEAIRKGIPCPGLVSVEGAATASMSPQSGPSVSAFSSSFAKPAQPAFGAPSFAKPAAPALGTPGFASKPSPSAPGPAFGSPAALGSGSPWSQGATAKPAFGQPAFGSTSAIGGGAGFGAASGLGQKASPWGSPAASTAEAKVTPFGSTPGQASGFSKLGSTSAASPFSSFSGNNATKASPFGNQPKPAFASATPLSSFGNSQQSFGSTVTIDSTQGGSTIGTKSVFGSFQSPAQQTPSLFTRPSMSEKSVDQEKSNDQDMSDIQSAAEPSAQKPAVGASLFSTQTPFKLDSTFKPAEGAKELGTEENGDGRNGPSLGDLGLTMSNILVKEDPEAPKKSLFDLPPLKEVSEKLEEDTSATNIKDNVVTPEVKREPPAQEALPPEPPQVTSKPPLSPVTTSSSGAHSIQSLRSSTAGESPEVLQRESSRISDVEGDDERSEAEEEGPEISEPSSDNEKTTARGHIESETPDSTIQSIVGSASNAGQTPLGHSPLGLKAISGLKHVPYSTSPSPLGKGIPPPAPTPPVSTSSRPLFGAINTTTPTGAPQPPFHFPAPKEQESPRSPSPVRSAANVVAAKPIRISAVPQPQLSQEDTLDLDDVDDDDEDDIEDSIEIASVSALSDDKDLQIRAELSQPIPARRDLPDFTAHQDYVGAVSLEGLAGNVEKVYRDINSMIDTLGLNARNLASFIKGHMDYPDLPREIANLDDDQPPWCIDELVRLENIESTLEKTVEAERVAEVLAALSSLATLNRAAKSLKDDARKMKAFLDTRKTPADADRHRRRDPPLDPATAALQRRLRAAVATHKALLVDAEDRATVVRAKLASRGKGRNVPTVEAVETTIRKMTAMVETRSGDVDVLEMQMRNLGIKPRTGTSSPAKGRTFSLDSYDGNGEADAEERVEMQNREERIARLIEVRRKRKAVLEKLRDGVEKKRLAAASVKA